MDVELAAATCRASCPHLQVSSQEEEDSTELSNVLCTDGRVVRMKTNVYSVRSRYSLEHFLQYRKEIVHLTNDFPYGDRKLE